MRTAVGRCAWWAAGLAALLAAGAASAGELWTENAAEAMAQAAREKKDLLMDFTGSDWCGWCKKLEAEVFGQPAFQAEAPKHFVFLKLDFPHQRPLSAETKQQNADLQAKYGVRGYPTIILADATGKQYAKTGYKAGGADAYLKHLDELRRNRPTPAEEPAVLPVAPSPTGGLWTENAVEAMAQAAKEKKDLLMDFTGSDWCGWCKKLDAEVFSQPAFQAEAAKRFVCLKLDFPHERPLSVETKKQNAEWARRFSINAYPTIVLADATGKPYAKTGYQAGGADAYLKQLDQLLKARQRRDRALAVAQKAGLERAKALDAALSALDPSLVGAYADEVEEIVRLDPENKMGVKAKYEAMSLMNRFDAAVRERRLQEAIALADQALKCVGATGEAAQDILFKKGEVLNRTQDKAGAKQALQDALQAAPNSPKAAKIRSILEKAFKE